MKLSGSIFPVANYAKPSSWFTVLNNEDTDSGPIHGLLGPLVDAFISVFSGWRLDPSDCKGD